MKWILYIGLLVVVGGFMVGLAFAFLPNKVLENLEAKWKERQRPPTPPPSV